MESKRSSIRDQRADAVVHHAEITISSRNSRRQANGRHAVSKASGNWAYVTVIAPTPHAFHSVFRLPFTHFNCFMKIQISGNRWPIRKVVSIFNNNERPSFMFEEFAASRRKKCWTDFLFDSRQEAHDTWKGVCDKPALQGISAVWDFFRYMYDNFSKEKKNLRNNFSAVSFPSNLHRLVTVYVDARRSSWLR